MSLRISIWKFKQLLQKVHRVLALLKDVIKLWHILWIKSGQKNSVIGKSITIGNYGNNFSQYCFRIQCTSGSVWMQSKFAFCFYKQKEQQWVISLKIIWIPFMLLGKLSWKQKVHNKLKEQWESKYDQVLETLKLETKYAIKEQLKFWRGPANVIGQDGTLVFVRQEDLLVRVHKARFKKCAESDIF